MDTNTLQQLFDWTQNHERTDKEKFDEILKQLKSLEDKLTPITDLYKGMAFSTKVVMGLLVFISVAVGAIVSIKGLFIK